MEKHQRRKKILIIFFSPPVGRIIKGERIKGYIDSLRKSEYEVQFIGLMYPLFGMVKNEGSRDFKLSRIAVVISLLFERLGKFFGISSVGRFLATLYLDVYAKLIIDWDEVDIIITQPYFLRTIKKAKKYHKKVILESEIDFPKYHWDIMKSRNNINNIPRRQWPSPNFYPYLARAVKSIEIADKIIVFGSHPFQTFINAGVKQDKLIKLIPPTSVISTNTPNTFSKFPVFVYIGNHGLRKGIDILFKSWEKYKSLGGDGELFIYGKPNKSDSKYRNLLIGLPGVYDQGFVEIGELLDETYKILISISFSEGFPRTVVEFLSAGQLVIANQPGGSELVKSGINGWQSSTDVAELVNTLFEVDKWWEKAKVDENFKVDRIEYPGSNFFSEVIKEIDQLAASQK